MVIRIRGMPEDRLDFLHHPPASQPTVKHSGAEVDDGFPLPLSPLHILGCTAPLMMDIANYILGLPEHPAVTPINGIPWKHFLDTLRERGIAVVLVLGLLPGHISKDYRIADMRIFLLELPQGRTYIGVEGALVSYIKDGCTMLDDKFFDGGIQRRFHIRGGILMPEKTTSRHIAPPTITHIRVMHIFYGLIFQMSTRIRVILCRFTVIIILTRKWVMLSVGAAHMDYSEIYVKRIRQLCKERGIAINRLAAMSDVKQSTLDNIVRGLTKNPRIKTLHKIALTFNMTVAEFLDFQELNEYSFEDDDDE